MDESPPSKRYVSLLTAKLLAGAKVAEPVEVVSRCRLGRELRGMITWQVRCHNERMKEILCCARTQRREGKQESLHHAGCPVIQPSSLYIFNRGDASREYLRDSTYLDQMFLPERLAKAHFWSYVCAPGACTFSPRHAINRADRTFNSNRHVIRYYFRYTAVMTAPCPYILFGSEYLPIQACVSGKR